jgi:hypothetical protein
VSGASRPPRLVHYRYPERSPAFSPEQLAYIESIHAFLDEVQLREVRAFEDFTLNLDFESLIAREIPGLRSSAKGVTVYIKRFGTEPYLDMAHRVLDLVLDASMGREVRQYVMRPFRVTLPSGDRYYPFTVGADPAFWRRRFEDAAATLGTLSAEFDRGWFVVSKGQVGEVYAFDLLGIGVASADDLSTW